MCRDCALGDDSLGSLQQRISQVSRCIYGLWPALSAKSQRNAPYKVAWRACQARPQGELSRHAILPMVVDATGDSFLFSSIDQWLKAMLSVKCVAELCKGMPGFANVVSWPAFAKPCNKRCTAHCFQQGILGGMETAGYTAHFIPRLGLKEIL